MSKRWEGETGEVFAKAECSVPLSDVVLCLGEEHYIEEDASKTASGVERFWIFDVGNDVALSFQYSDVKNHLLIGLNNRGPIHAKLLQRFLSFSTSPTEGIMWQ